MGRRKPCGNDPPVAAKYLLLFIPPHVISSDLNNGVHTGLPTGLQVFLRLTHGWV